jgi:hypothetical protein
LFLHDVFGRLLVCVMDDVQYLFGEKRKIAGATVLALDCLLNPRLVSARRSFRLAFPGEERRGEERRDRWR